MRVSREQAAENRDRILDVAGRLFRERGFAGIGVSDLMKAAGLTHGGFYGHFASKDDLAAQACERVVEQTVKRWRDLVASDRSDPLEPLLAHYMSCAHRDDPARGCVYAALAAEVAREKSPRLRHGFTIGLRSMLDILSRIAPGRSAAARRERAVAKMAAMVGAVVLARAVDDKELSGEILSATRKALGGRSGSPAA